MPNPAPDASHTLSFNRCIKLLFSFFCLFVFPKIIKSGQKTTNPIQSILEKGLVSLKELQVRTT